MSDNSAMTEVSSHLETDLKQEDEHVLLYRLQPQYTSPIVIQWHHPEINILKNDEVMTIEGDDLTRRIENSIAHFKKLRNNPIIKRCPRKTKRKSDEDYLNEVS